MSVATALIDKGVMVVGWALLYSLWQGLLIGVAYALLRKFARQETERYVLGVLMLLAMALCPVVTAFHLWSSTPLPGLMTSTVNEHIPSSVEIVPPSSTLFLSRWSWLEDFFPGLVALWVSGVIFLGVNLVRQYRHLNRLLQGNTHVLPEWQAALRRLCNLFTISQPVQLRLSSRVDTPTLIGFLKPVILLPMGMMTGFSLYQIEMILAHELGHLRRWDYVVNLGQIVIETLLFYHPVVYWISRDVRNSREICCDELALTQTKSNPVEYAQVLAELEAFRQAETFALAANGGVLLKRIQSIIVFRKSDKNSTGFAANKIKIVGVVGIGLFAIFSFLNLNRQFSASMQTTEDASTMAISSPAFLYQLFPLSSSFEKISTLIAPGESVLLKLPFIDELPGSKPQKIAENKSQHSRQEEKSDARVNLREKASRSYKLAKSELSSVPVQKLTPISTETSIESTSPGKNANKIDVIVDHPFQKTNPGIGSPVISGEKELDIAPMVATSAPIMEERKHSLQESPALKLSGSTNKIACEYRRQLGSNIKQKVCAPIFQATELALRHFAQGSTRGSRQVASSDSYGAVRNFSPSVSSTTSLTKRGFNSPTRSLSPYQQRDLTRISPPTACARGDC